MKKSVPTTLILILALAALSGCANPADDKPQAEVREAAADPAAAAQDGDRYVLGAETKIGFVGSKVTGSHDGGFNGFDGEITVAGDDPTTAQVRVEIDTTSIWSDHPKLTEHLKSPDFFDVATYPTAEFASTAVEADGDGYRITGNLTMHGVTKSIAFPAAIEMADGGIRASAEFAIKRFDWNIEYKGRADDLIRDDVVISLDLVASPAG